MMKSCSRWMRRFLATWLVIGTYAVAADPGDAGMIKSLSGRVSIERGTDRLPALTGMLIQRSDVVRTEDSSSVGIMLRDNSMLALGPLSELRLDQFSFDPQSQKGAIEATLKRGSLAGVSGAIVKNSPEAVRFQTSSMTLGVRGTKFIIEAFGKGE